MDKCFEALRVIYKILFVQLIVLFLMTIGGDSDE